MFNQTYIFKLICNEFDFIRNICLIYNKNITLPFFTSIKNNFIIVMSYENLEQK